MMTKLKLLKILKKYHVIKQILSKLYAHTLIILYKSLILPHIDYCSNILYLLNDQQIEKLQSLRNKIMRLILKAPYDMSINNMLNILEWLSVKQRI
jgi:hypothetical protein